MRDALTDRQREILSFVLDGITANGYPPTVREIASHFGFASPNGAQGHLKALERKGYLRVGRGQRAIEVIDELRRDRGTPILGRVPAGSPILAEEHLEGVLNLGDRFGNPRDLFALQVVGDSMVDDGIFDGDYVIVRSQARVDPGDIGVALIGEEATVKRIYPERGGVRLQPANDHYEPIRVDANSPEFRIAGKVVGLVRSFERTW